MKKSISNKKTAYLAGVVLLVILWQLLAFRIGEEKMVFPGPFATLKHALFLLGREYTWRCIAMTMKKMLQGFLIAFGLGIIFGTISGNKPFIRQLFSPLITTLRAIPTASLVYLFIVLYGFKKAPMILVILMSFPIIYEGVCSGIENIDSSIIDASKLDGGSFLTNNIFLYLPLALPYIITAFLTSFSLSFKVEIMAEVITGAADAGLGSAIAGVRSADPTNMVPVFAYSLIAVGMMLMIDFVLTLIREKIDIN